MSAGLLLVGFAAASAANGAQSWPTIAPMHTTYEWVNPTKEGVDTPFLTTILSPSGQPLYKIECHDGDYDDESEINFSGDFQCALFALHGPPSTFVDLLASDTKDELSTDWWNRGRVMSYQLQDPCLQYPEYSTSRHFRLRGMLITLGISRIEWSPNIPRTIAPARFTMTFDAVPDTRAVGFRAALPGGPKPPHGCYP